MNIEQERAELLPCPFCGGTNIEIQTSTPDREGVPTNLMCTDCGASGPWEYEQGNSHAKAVNAWNRRAALQSQVKKDTTLFCDLKTDEEKSAFFLSGRGYETGVIAYSIQNDVAMAYQRCAEYRKELEALQAENERLRCIIRDLKDWDCDVRGGFLSIPVDLRRRMQEAVDRARRIEGERE